MEEITELRNRVSDSVVVLSAALLSTDTVVLVADGRERLEVRVDEQDVRALNIHKSGGGVRVALLGTRAHDVLHTLVKKLGRHNHAIGLAIVGNQLENTSS